VDDLAGEFGVTIEAEDVETVGGLLAQALGRVPIAGSVATVAGLRLTAENLAGRRNRIGTVLVERLGPGPPGAGPAGQGEEPGSSERAGVAESADGRQAGEEAGAARDASGAPGPPGDRA
jgi:hypothetical protein